MIEHDSLRIVKDNLDVVLIVLCAYALAAWLVFDHLRHHDEIEELGDVNMHDLHRLRDADADVVDSSVVRAASITRSIEREFGPLDAWQREELHHRLRERLRDRRRVVNG